MATLNNFNLYLASLEISVSSAYFNDFFHKVVRRVHFFCFFIIQCFGGLLLYRRNRVNDIKISSYCMNGNHGLVIDKKNVQKYFMERNISILVIPRNLSYFIISLVEVSNYPCSHALMVRGHDYSTNH